MQAWTAMLANHAKQVQSFSEVDCNIKRKRSVCDADSDSGFESKRLTASQSAFQSASQLASQAAKLNTQNPLLILAAAAEYVETHW